MVHIRLVAVLALALLALGVLAGSSRSAASPPTIGPFIGDWTMTSNADPALVGFQLQITESNASGAKSLVGPEWLNPTETAWYDSHCGSKATVYAYVVLTYTWPPQGSMGGCLSNKTGPHVVFAGSKKEAGSVRIGNSAGLDALTGTWDTIENYICCHHHAIDGARTSVTFAVGEQGHLAQPKTKNGPKFLLTKLLGVGGVSLVDGKPDAYGQYDTDISDATGTIHFHKWRVYEHGVIDEDLLALSVQKVAKSHYHRSAEVGVVSEVGVTVTKSEHGETDNCPVGTTGTLTMLERMGGDYKGKDIVLLKIAGCGVNEGFTNGFKGSKVGVNLTLKKP